MLKLSDIDHNLPVEAIVVKSLTVSFLLCVCALVSGAQDAATKRAITPEDVLTIRELFEVNLSPDGKHVAFTVTEPTDPKKPREPRTSNVWIVSTDGSDTARPVIPGLRNASMPKWSPDGQAFAFLSDEGVPNSGSVDKSTQVYLLRNGENKAVRVTSASAGVDTFEWSRDGRMIGYLSGDLPSAEVQARRSAGFDAAVFPERDVTYERLWITNLADGATTRVPVADIEIKEFAWSPDSREFALVTTPTPLSRDSNRMSLIVVDRASGRVARRLAQYVSPISGVLRWSPDGEWISFFEVPPSREYNNWLSIVPARGGPVRSLQKTYQGSTLKCEWATDSQSFLTLAVEGTHSVIARTDVKSGVMEKITDVKRSQWGSTLSTNGDTHAYLAQTIHSDNDLYVVTKGRPPRRLTEFNPQTRSWALGGVREVVWKNTKDALERRGILITPYGYRPGMLYPTVVNAHPGDTAWWVGFHASKWWDWGQLLASNGYMVFLPNTRGVTGEGGAMHATNSHWGGMAYQDLMDGLDSLVAQKIVDPDRLGIGGWSNGGFMTEYSITHTTRFKAAVGVAGHSDFFSLYGTSYLREDFRMLPGKSPYVDRSWYDEHSPITNVSKCRTPTLLLHGAGDSGVPVGQAYEFYTGLRDAGVDTELVIYPREGHSIQEYPHRIDLQRRMLAWFDRYLKRPRSTRPAILQTGVLE